MGAACCNLTNSSVELSSNDGSVVKPGVKPNLTTKVLGQSTKMPATQDTMVEDLKKEHKPKTKKLRIIKTPEAV